MLRIRNSPSRAVLLLALCAMLFHLQSNLAAAAPPQAPPETCIVQSGDSLYRIALRYGGCP